MEQTESVTGVKRFNSKDHNVSKPSFSLLTTGDYELKVQGDKVSVSAPSQRNPDGVPYIKAQFEVLGTAKDENGKNQKLFPMFFLTTQPTKEGSPWVAVTAQGSITDLAKALGEDLDVSVITYTTSSGKEIEILNPLEVLEWLKNKDGLVVKAHVKQEKGGTYKDDEGNEQSRPDSNKIARFIAG